MSRIEHEIPNTPYKLVYGVDSITSVFVDIRDTSKDEDSDDYHTLSINNLGVECDNNMPAKGLKLAQEFIERFRYARSTGNPYPNLNEQDVIMIAKCFGMDITPDFIMEVYRTLD